MSRDSGDPRNRPSLPPARPTERRDEWNCGEVLYAGDGPESRRWTLILSVTVCTAAEAAECYAEERMNDYTDGIEMYVAVEAEPGKFAIFKCVNRMVRKVETYLQTERTDIVKPKGYE